ncbi:MAG: DNA primase large subunit PriL [Candidatus Brockarchaeota archaeon]|nr:DNA primase large subunit PriL [Candidatus Brockarchaeota archaeon]
MSVLRYAKYPFLRGAAAFVSEQVDLQLKELGKEEFKPVVRRAKQRVMQALKQRRVVTESRELVDYVSEVLSFPTAVAMVSAINDDRLRSVYSLSEAKAAYESLKDEDPKTLLAISRELGIRAKPSAGPARDFDLDFEDYLLHAARFHQPRWKLVNRKLDRGMVQVTQRELARILQEAIQRRVYEKTTVPLSVEDLPESVSLEVGELRENWEKIKRSFGAREAVKDDETNRPPCVKRMLERLSKGEHLSHPERFALTTYLSNSGHAVEEILGLYSSSPDFNAARTEYQVRHLAGEMGSRTRYKPPKCSTMKTQGICPGGDDVCQRIRHPLQYPAAKLGGKGG